jgi:hypothetical protein
VRRWRIVLTVLTAVMLLAVPKRALPDGSHRQRHRLRRAGGVVPGGSSRAGISGRRVPRRHRGVVQAPVPGPYDQRIPADASPAPMRASWQRGTRQPAGGSGAAATTERPTADGTTPPSALLPSAMFAAPRSSLCRSEMRMSWWRSSGPLWMWPLTGASDDLGCTGGCTSRIAKAQAQRLSAVTPASGSAPPGTGLSRERQPRRVIPSAAERSLTMCVGLRASGRIYRARAPGSILDVRSTTPAQ